MTATHADASRIADEIITAPNENAHHLARRVLRRFGSDALALMAKRGIRIVMLRRGQRFVDHSPTLRELSPHIDDWPHPPAGLFVVAERTAYIRRFSEMALAHEAAHALDLALGDENYHSSNDAELRALFFSAPKFVTPYAATAPDEWLAETLRAYREAGNDRACPWPRATRERLQSVHPEASMYMERLFTEIIPARLAAA